MPRKLNQSDYNLANRLLEALDNCLRVARVHDLLGLKEESHRRSAIEHGTLLQGGPYATRAGRGLSKLCLTLVFGRSSAGSLWTSLHTGSAIKPSLFPRATKRLLHMFDDRTNVRLNFDADFSQLLHKINLGSQLADAEAKFFSSIHVEDIERLCKALTSELESPLKSTPHVDEFSEEYLDRIEFDAADMENIGLNDDYRLSGYVISTYTHGIGLWSPEVSDRLILDGRSWQPVVANLTAPFSAPNREIGWKKLLDAQRLKQTAFNVANGKMGLKSDILLRNGKLPSDILLQVCDYVDNLSTNDIAQQIASLRTHDGDGAVRTDLLLAGQPLYTDGLGHFLGYRDSRCSNQLGASSLAVTNDCVPILVRQLPKNMQSSTKTAPSGSGSLDYPNDFKDLNGGIAFGEWLHAISLRELREELGIDPNAKNVPAQKKCWMETLNIDTICVGFGGLMHRAGKPDFFFLTRLHCTLHEIVENSHYSNTEKELSALVADIKDQALKKLDAANLKIFCEAQQVMSRQRNSVPLAMLYDMIVHAARNHEQRITEFLKGGNSPCGVGG